MDTFFVKYLVYEVDLQCDETITLKVRLYLSHMPMSIFNIKSAVHSWAETRALLTDYDTRLGTAENIRSSRPVAARFMKEEAKKILSDQSIHTLLPLPCNFPFVGVTPYMDVYSLFIGESIHVFDLELSRMMK